MYTARKIAQGYIDGIFSVTVEFSNGTKTLVEKVKPQDYAGYLHWLRSRKQSLDTSEILEAEGGVGEEIDLSEPIPVDTRTQAEKDRDAWLVKYHRWISIKKNLIDTGVVPANNVQVVAFLDDVKAGFKAAYINFI